MSKRPLLSIGCICLIVTMAALFYSLPKWTPLLFLATALLCCILFDQKKMWIPASLGIAAALACVCTFGWEQKVEHELQWVGKTQEVQGMILSSQQNPSGTRYEVLCKLDSGTVRLPLMCWDKEAIEMGHVFEAAVSFEKENSFYYQGRGAVLRGDSPKLIDLGEGTGLRAFFLRIRRELLSRMDVLFHGTGREILKSILFGERTDLSGEVQDVFRTSGAFHILAVSGFHISTIGGGFYLLLKKMRQNQRLTAFVVLPFLFVLAGIEGWEVSVLRAALMGGLFYLAKVVRRDYDPLTAWAASLLMVLIHPYYVKNIGFWMSYGAVLGIILFAPILTKELWRHIPIHKDKKKRWMEQVVSLVSVSMASQIFLIPMQLIFFGGFSWMTILSSLLIFPLMLPIFLFAVGALLLFGIFEPAALLFAEAAQLLCGVLYWILRTLASLEPMIYGQKEWVILWFLLLYGVIALLYRAGAKRKTVFHALLSCGLIFLGTMLWTNSNKTNAVSLFGCEKTLILVKEDKAAVLGSLDSPWDVEEAEQILNGMGVQKVDVLCLTASKNQSGTIAADFSKRWDAEHIILEEAMDAFDFAHIPYTVLNEKEGIRFWENWELTLLQEKSQGMILRGGKKKFLKLQEKYAIMTKIEPEYSAVFGEDHLVFGREDLRWKKTWFGALMACIEE